MTTPTFATSIVILDYYIKMYQRKVKKSPPSPDLRGQTCSGEPTKGVSTRVCLFHSTRRSGSTVEEDNSVVECCLRYLCPNAPSPPLADTRPVS